jgi:hypothetical protein
MKHIMLIAVIGLCACSVDAAPVPSSRMSSVKKGLFGAAGRGGSQIAELDIPDGGPVKVALRPTRPVPDAGELPQDAGEPSPDAMLPPEPDAGAPDAGAPEDAGTPLADAGSAPTGVGVCGPCSATAPCAEGLLCVDVQLNGGPYPVGTPTHRCYIDCSSQAGKDACAVSPTPGACSPTIDNAQTICPMAPHTYLSACKG